MKVPTYQAQTARTTKPGGIGMQVSASPQALSLEARAASDFFAQASDTAFKYAEKEIKIKNQRDLDNAELIAKEQINNAQMAALDDDADKSVENFDKKVKTIRSTVAQSIESDYVRGLFLNKFDESVLSTRLNVRKDARVRTIDASKAAGFEIANKYIRQAATGNSLEIKQAQRELFGVDVPSEGPGIGQRVVGIYERMANDGLISQVDRVTYEKAAREQIAKSTLRGEIASVDRQNNPDLTDALAEKVADPTNYEYLSPNDRDTFYAQLVNLSQAQEKKLVSDAAKKEKDDAREAKANQNALHGQITSRINRAVQNPNNSEAQGDMPSLLEINEHLANGRLRPEQASSLNDLVNNLDASKRDPALIGSIHAEINAADNAEEIEAAVARAIPHIGRNGSIPTSDYISILKSADTAKSNAPRQKRISKYEQILKVEIGESSGTIGGIGVKLDPAERARRADALDTYYRLVTDPQDPLEPRDAYLQTIDQFRFTQGQDKYGFLGPSDFVRNTIGDKPLRDYTIEDISAARQAVMGTSSLTHLQKSIEYETLDTLQRAIESRLANPPIDPEAAGSGERTFFQSFADLFSGSNDSAADIRNPQ